MATATTVKTALKVLYDKSPQNPFQALVIKKAEGEDEVKNLTENDLRKMTKIQRKSWSVRALRSYRTLPRELHMMKPGTEACKKE